MVTHDQRNVGMPAVIPVMAPGQECRPDWDTGRERIMSELPKQHVGQVTYLGIDKEPMSSQAILVWSINESRIWTVQHGMHDLAKAVRDIRDTN